LLSPKGSIALNNDDTFIAGTDLFPNRSSQGPDTYAVISKVDQLLTALNDARTVVNIEGRATEVPRLGLVGVYDRGTKPGGVRA
jgi:hypothetical protein